MEQILVTKVNGSTYLLEDRNAFRIIQSINQKIELRSNDIIDINLESREFFSFTIGDSFTYFGKKYTLNQIPKVDKVHSNLFRYSITFEGVQFDLRRASYDVNIDTTGSAIYGETLTANLELFLRVLIENANRVFPGKWTLGAFPSETETKTLTFSEEENCLSVLQTLCNEYDYDFTIKTENGVNILNILQVGQEIALEFKVGFQQGLYNLSRDKVDSNDIVTRLKVYGSSQNLGTDYRSNRLVLAGKNKPNSYIDNTAGIAKYGIYEQTKIFEDIYPRRKGKVTAIDSNSVLKFKDSSMDFDLKERDSNGTKYLLDGVSAKIHFNTGNLAGYEFEISDYNHSTKEFTIIKFTDENDYTFPATDNNVFRIGVNDEYVILDIKMPQSYIDNAEAELLEKGTEFLADKQEPLVQYTLDIDTLFLQRALNDTVNEFFQIGDFVKVIDTDLELNRYIRIKAIERNLNNPFDYKLTLSDAKVTASLSNSIISDINTINNIIRINNLNDPARAKRNWKDAQEVLDMVFDVEGDYYTEKIKPNSIETMHLQVGAKSMQFNLIDSRFEPNLNGNPNLIQWSTCKLIHFTIEENIKEWQITAGNKTLEANKPYYIYARCNKNNNIGVIEITETQYKVDTGNYYYFLIGILNSYDSTILAREISLMYGFSTISGRFIKTGRIQSADGETYFDLDSGEIKGRITFTSDSPAYEQLYNGLTIGTENLLVNTELQFDSYSMDESKIQRYAGSILDYSVGVDVIHSRVEDVCLYVIGKDSQGNGTLLGYKVHTIRNANTRQRISSTLRCDISLFKKIFLVLVRESNNETIQTEFIQPKLEVGLIATDYNQSQTDIISANEERIAEIENKVSFMNTTISGNIVATGMLMVGNVLGPNAGISGFSENGNDSVRFWAGSKATNRNSAPFRVLDNGKVFMTDAYVEGEINATSGVFSGIVRATEGYIGGFEIKDNILKAGSNVAGVWFDSVKDNSFTSVKVGNYIGDGIPTWNHQGNNLFPVISIEGNDTDNLNLFRAGIYINLNLPDNSIVSKPAIQIDNGHISGIALPINSYIHDETINANADVAVFNTNGSNFNNVLYLPDTPRIGKVLTIMNIDSGASSLSVRSRSHSIGRGRYGAGDSISLSKSGIFMFIGNIWIMLSETNT